jgi:hypothetical protein
LYVVHNLPTKLPQKNLNEESLFSILKQPSKSFKCHKLAPPAVLG